ncbi:ATP-binding protein [Micromonospora chersina]|uniref:ATP-binding protein n=1 Tax=Micromonospora chersina TaxID=47854 RepID=UPI0037170AE2
MSRPDLPHGPLRALSDALHTLHHQAGWPSLRAMASDVGCSRTTVSAVFSEAKVPRWGLVELIVENLGGDVERFRGLWLAATSGPPTDPVSVGAARPTPDAGEAAPARSLIPVAAVQQLPAATAAFVGRAEAMAEVDRLLRPAGPAVAICVLSGTAGVGKTALAVRCAHRAAGRFPDGILYTDLHGYHPARPVDADDVLAEFIRAVGPPGTVVPEGSRERAALYRSLLAGQRMLLVLDNAGSTDQVRQLLPGTPTCAVLVTSRDALTGLVVREGAVRLGIERLPEVEAVGLLTALAGTRVTAEPAATARLAAACAGLPLALRIAAELVATRPDESLSELADELDDAPRRLALLDAGDAYSAIRSVFSWSYDHLTDAAARLFRLLGVHAGADLDVSAVAALADVDVWTADRLLAELARGHLVERTGRGRFGMHDLLRAYAGELAARHPDEAVAARRRLSDHYTAAARAAAAETSASGRQWLAVERPNLLTVAQISPRHATQLSAILADFLDSGGHYDDAYRLHELSRQAAVEAADPAAEALALDRLGVIKRRQGDYRGAQADHARAAAIFERIADRVGLARALQQQGIVAWRTGRYAQARQHLGRALQLADETGDRRTRGSTLYNLGIVHRRLGEYPRALSCHQDALTEFQAIGDRVGLGRALNNVAVVHLRLGAYQAALEALERSLAIQREEQDRAGECAVLTNLGLAYERTGRLDDALAVLTTSLDIAEDIGNPVCRADALRWLGVVNGRLGRYDEGERLLRAALHLGRTLDEDDTQTGALNELGELLVDAGRHDDARPCLTQALARATAADDRYERGRALLHLSRASPAGEAERAEAVGLFAGMGIPLTTVLLTPR